MSTFMLEMTETAHILRHATARSLIILDEVGRGTGTTDGLAIARAVIEYLVRRVRAKTLFTTHYHEVTTLADRLAAVGNACLQVRDDGGDVIFLYKVLPGVSSHSYGLHVARLAGLPEEVVTQAAAWLAEPAAPALPTPATADPPCLREQALLPQAIAERLRRIDPLHTTPFEALQLLHELRERLIHGATVDQPASRAPR
jgi:DNA mismatch repair protein MutS